MREGHRACGKDPFASLGRDPVPDRRCSEPDSKTEHSPVGNRDARYVLNVAGSWEQADDDKANVEWAREAWNDMKSFSTGGTYINFLTEDEGPERIEAALGRGLQRLAEVKAKWDPENRIPHEPQHQAELRNINVSDWANSADL